MANKYIINIFIVFVFNISLSAIEYNRNFVPGLTVDQGDTIWINVQLTNDELSDLKGLVYSEHVPIGIHIVDHGVIINGNEYSDYTFEIDNSAAVYPNRYSYRWILQTPPDFLETGVVSPGSKVEINYGLTTNTSMNFTYNSDAWYGGVVTQDTLAPLFGFESLSTIELEFRDIMNIVDDEIIPVKTVLHQNYPNPFNPSTIIRYGLPKKEWVSIEIYNLLGQRIMILVNGIQSAGYHEVEYKRSNMTSGIYFYTLRTKNHYETKKMLLLQ